MTLETRGVAGEIRTSGETNPLVELRPLSSQEELRACVEMQREIWGEDFADVVPTSILKITTQVGGIVAGAFDPGGSLLGFVYGITGVKDGEIAHWSHMLGVTADAQRQGIGRALKQYQRAELRKLGVVTMYWTFDPLVARNAHFNFNVLGVRATGYVAHMYGEGTSPLHRGIGTDRLIVSWPVDRPDASTHHRDPGLAGTHDGADVLTIRIPGDIGALQQSDMAQARDWRERTRHAFQRALSDGWIIAGFERDEAARQGIYVLRREGGGVET